MVLQQIKKHTITRAIYRAIAFSAIAFNVSCDEDSALDDTEIQLAEQSTSFFTTDISDLDVIFRNYSLGATSFEWDFDDGNTSTEVSPSHTYEDYGSYMVTLKAFDSAGNLIKESTQNIVTAAVNFTFELEDNVASFDNASASVASFEWNFGDGIGTSTDENPTYTYTVAGNYTVILTAFDENGVSIGTFLQEVIGVTVPVDGGGGVQPTFDAVILNGTADEFTVTTGDNADAFDMTPNSTVIGDDGVEVDSPYSALWNNSDLNAYIDATYGTNEQSSSTSDGSFINGEKTRGLKLNETSRRLYQLFAVEVGVQYRVSIDTRAEAEGLNTEVFILNTEITTEEGIESFADASLVIDNDFNSSKGSETENTFTTNTITFTASSNIAVFYVRSLTAIDGDTEVFIDNISIESGVGVSEPTVVATQAAVILNGGADEFTLTTGDNADAFDMTPNSTVIGDDGVEVDSPYRALWNNSDLNAYLDATFVDATEQPSSTSDGSYVNGELTRGLKLNETSRRLYQLFAVEVGVQYTVSIDTRAEAEGLNTEVFILNTEITTEEGIESFADASLVIDNDFNSSKGSATENTFTTNTITFTASSDIAVFYVRSLTAIDGDTEIFIDNISVATPGF